MFCVFLYLLHMGYENIHFTQNVWTRWGSEAILASPHKFKGLTEGKDTELILRLGSGLGVRQEGYGQGNVSYFCF